jgi:hypothetical protein
MAMKIKEAKAGKGLTTMQPINFVAIMAILNAIVQRFNDDAVKSNLAILGQPCGAGVPVNGAMAPNGSDK